MRLVGRFLSPFVRRVAIALELYGIPYEHEPLAPTDDRTGLVAVSKLGRVPCLVLDDGDVLVDSGKILDELDRMVGRERALVPADPGQARAYGQMIALLTGSLEKCIVTSYELLRRPADKVWQEWADRCSSQAAGGLLEAEARAADSLRDGGFLFGDRITHADIAGAIAYEWAKGFAPDEIDADKAPRFAALSTRLAATPEFIKTQPA